MSHQQIQVGVHRVIAHDAKVLSAYIDQRVALLPRLNDPGLSEKQVHQRSINYHSTCSDALREINALIHLTSPILAELVAKVWDLASMNFLVLVKLLQNKMQQSSKQKSDFDNALKFNQEMNHLGLVSQKNNEQKLEEIKHEMLEVRSESFKLRKKNERLAAENQYLQEILKKILNFSPDRTEADSDDDDDIFFRQNEEVKEFREVSNLESLGNDMNKMFGALADQTEQQVKLVNHMDRFMSSNLVSILWKNHPGEKSNFLEKLMKSKSEATQTDLTLTDVLNDTHGKDSQVTLTPSSIEFEAETIPKYISKATIKIPMEFKVHLRSCPKVSKVLPKRTLCRLILQLYLEMMESNAKQIQGGENGPLETLGKFIYQKFAANYGLQSLADFHMVELLKSLFYYRKKLSNREKMLTKDPYGGNLEWDDARILLFGRFCHLFTEEELRSNITETCLPSMLDMLGDAIEIDPSIKSLSFLIQDQERPIPLSKEVCVMVFQSHLEYLPEAFLNGAVKKLRESTTNADWGDSSSVSLDYILGCFVEAWCRGEEEFDTQLRLAFHEHCNSSSNSLAANNKTRYLEFKEFVSAVSALDGDGDCEQTEIKKLFVYILDAKKPQPKKRMKGSEKRNDGSLAPTAIEGSGVRSTGDSKTDITPVSATTKSMDNEGVTEEEFVLHAGSLLRSKRPQNGIRTAGVPLYDRGSRTLVGGMGRTHFPGAEMKLKPGFE